MEPMMFCVCPHACLFFLWRRITYELRTSVSMSTFYKLNPGLSIIPCMDTKFWIEVFIQPLRLTTFRSSLLKRKDPSHFDGHGWYLSISHASHLCLTKVTWTLLIPTKFTLEMVFARFRSMSMKLYSQHPTEKMMAKAKLETDSQPLATVPAACDGSLCRYLQICRSSSQSEKILMIFIKWNRSIPEIRSSVKSG